MTPLRKFLISSLLAGAFVVSGCGSSTNSSTDTAATTTSSTTTTTVADEATTTTAAATTTAAPTTASPTTAAVVTSPPTTAPAPTGPKVTSMKVDAAPDCSGGGFFQLNLSWQVTGADNVYLAIDNPDGPYQNNIGNSGSTTVPFTCGDTQVYYIVAQKGGQKDVESRTRP